MLESLGGKYSGIYTEKLKNGQVSFFIAYKENGSSKRKKVGVSPDMTKSKALVILQEKRLELKNSGSVVKTGIEPTTKISNKTGNYTLNDLADLYFKLKTYGTVKEVKIKYDYHIREEAFARKLIQLISQEDILEFKLKKETQRADKRRVVSKTPIEVKEGIEYQENLQEIRRKEVYLEAFPEDWREKNKLELLKKWNEILFVRIDPEARQKLMNKVMGIDEKNFRLGLLSRKTVKEIFLSCSMILNFATEVLNINFLNPFSKISIRVDNERDRYMKKSELQDYLQEVKKISLEQHKHKNIYLISLLALSTASRQTTVLSIKIGDIDLENKIIKLLNHKKERSFTYSISSDEEEAEIIKLIGNRGSEEYLFVNYTEENPYRYPRIMKEVLDYTVNYKRNFFDWLSLKEFRNTTASNLSMAGVPLAHIGQVLDHTDPRSTQRYARLQPSSAKQGVSNYMGDILKKEES